MCGRATNALRIQNILGVDISDIQGRYLGLPLFFGRLTKDLCTPIVDRIKLKLECWKQKLLSTTGRLELIKSTLSSYSLFWSSAFPLPSASVKDIEKIC